MSIVHGLVSARDYPKLETRSVRYMRYFRPIRRSTFVLYLNPTGVGFLSLGGMRFTAKWTSSSKTRRFHFSGVPPNGAVEQSLLVAILWLFAILALILLRNRERTFANRIRQIGGGAVSLRAALWPAPYLVGGIALIGGAIMSLDIALPRSRLMEPESWQSTKLHSSPFGSRAMHCTCNG